MYPEAPVTRTLGVEEDISTTSTTPETAVERTARGAPYGEAGLTADGGVGAGAGCGSTVGTGDEVDGGVVEVSDGALRKLSDTASTDIVMPPSNSNT